ncbi:MAG: glycine cleavage T C-terminal barrel domain-containing protein [Candidatus Poseidoniaceae archaeon]|nr:glycine cleavage T C-terminal barrel domain-containing protein [Candidatus Poseidoniaceae archaeon]
MGDSVPVRTALYEEHVSLGGNVVDFHGFELPIWYSNITDEHLKCRSEAGIFDVSHMGTFRFSGNNVRGWLESIATQKCSRIEPGTCAYTHFLDHEGYLIDDMIFAVVNSEEILGVPNASMVPVMWDWFSKLLPKDNSISLEDLSEETSIIALQGPESRTICESVLGIENHVDRFKWSAIGDNPIGITGWIQGTGYTGESGYEIFIPNNEASKLWNALLEAGATPVGLGARDTLRLEKGFLLSGVDFLSPTLGEDKFLHRDSWETNVPFGLEMEHDFIGKSRVISHSDGDARLWGVLQLEKGPLPRGGKQIEDLKGNVIGRLTSGAPSPSLDRSGIGMGYIESVEEGDYVMIVASPRKKVRAVIKRPPFI